MWCRHLVIYSAAHTLALWAMGLGFAVCALLLRSPLAAVLVSLSVVALLLAIFKSAKARRIRADASTEFPGSRLRKVTESKPRKDGKTGLAALSEIADAFRQRLSVFENSGEPFSLVIIDIRDAWPSDAALNQDAMATIVEILLRIIDTEDSLAQTGGSEFAALLANTREFDAELFGWRVIHTLDALALKDLNLVAPVISVGVAECSEVRNTIGALAKVARTPGNQVRQLSHRPLAA